MTITPRQALNNLAQIADEASMNGPNRRISDLSVSVLNDLVLAHEAAAKAKPAEETPPKSAKKVP